jgi:hypothetical protein
VDTTKEWNTFLTWGVDAIITDNPLALRVAIKRAP